MSENTKKFYTDIYTEVYQDDPEYGAVHGQQIIRPLVDFLATCEAPRVHIDCGCGRIQFGKILLSLMKEVQVKITSYAVDVYQYHTIPDGVIFVKDTVWDLSQIPEQADAITCLDVLEHLTEADVERTLSHMRTKLQVLGRIYVTVGLNKAVHRSPPGTSNLHLTVKPSAWWESCLSKYFDIIHSVKDGGTHTAVGIKREAIS